MGNHVGSFECNLGTVNVIFIELMGAILAIEHAYAHGWSNFLLEPDSKLVVMVFSKPFVVPWQIRNRWDNCTNIIRNFNFWVTHLYREGNYCTGKLVNIGLDVSNFTWWNDVHLDIKLYLIINRLELSNFRII